MADDILKPIMVKLGIDANKFKEGLKNSGVELAKFGKEMGAFALLYGPIENAIKKTADVISIASLAMQGFAIASTMAAAKAEVMGTVMHTVAQNMAISTEAVDKATESIKKRGITTTEANQTLIQFMQSELKVTDATNMARTAQDLAVAANQNSSEALQTLIYSVSSLEPRLLKQFGLTKSLDDIEASYAKKIEKTAASLTVQEKKQAMVNYILVEGKKMTGNYEMAMENAAKKAQSLTRMMEEMHMELGQAGLQVYKPIIDLTYGLMKVFEELPAPIKAASGAVMIFGSMFGSLASPLSRIGLGFVQLTGSIALFGMVAKGAWAVISTVGGEMLAFGTQTFIIFSNMIKSFIAEIGGAIVSIIEGADASKVLAVALSGMALNTVIAAGAMKDLTITTWESITADGVKAEILAKKSVLEKTSLFQTKLLTISGKEYNAVQLVQLGTSKALLWTQQGLSSMFLSLWDQVKKVTISMYGYIKGLYTAALSNTVLGAKVSWTSICLAYELAAIKVTTIAENIMTISTNVLSASLGFLASTAGLAVLSIAALGYGIYTLIKASDDLVKTYKDRDALITKQINLESSIEKIRINYIDKAIRMSDISIAKHKEINDISGKIADAEEVRDKKKALLETDAAKILTKEADRTKEQIVLLDKVIEKLKEKQKAIKDSENNTKKDADAIALMRENIQTLDDAKSIQTTIGSIQLNNNKLLGDYNKELEDESKNNFNVVKTIEKASRYVKLREDIKAIKEKILSTEAEKVEIDKLVKSYQEQDIKIRNLNRAQEYANSLFEVGLATQEDILKAEDAKYEYEKKTYTGTTYEQKVLRENADISNKITHAKYMDYNISKDRNKLQYEITMGMASEKDMVIQTHKEWTDMYRSNLYNQDTLDKKWREDQQSQKALRMKDFEVNLEQNRYLVETHRKSQSDAIDFEIKMNRMKLKEINLTAKERKDAEKEGFKLSQKKAEFTIEQNEKTTAHEVNMNRITNIQKYDADRKYYNDRVTAGLLYGEEEVEANRKLWEEFRGLQFEEAKKSEDRWNRWKQAADMNWLDKTLLLEATKKDFNINTYAAHYDKVLQHQYETTEKITQDEEKVVLDYTKNISKAYEKMASSYTVNLSSASIANDAILKSFDREVFKTQKDLFDYERKMGDERLRIETDIEKKKLATMKSEIDRESKADKDWKQRNQSKISMFITESTKVHDLEIKLIQREIDKEKEKLNLKISGQEKIKDYLYERTHTEQQKAQYELKKEIEEFKKNNVDKNMIAQYTQEKLKEIFDKTGEASEKSADKVVDSFDRIDGAMKGTQKTGDKWFKTIEDFMSTDSMKSAPMFTTIDELSNNADKAMSGVNKVSMAMKGAGDANDMFRPDMNSNMEKTVYNAMSAAMAMSGMNSDRFKPQWQTDRENSAKRAQEGREKYYSSAKDKSDYNNEKYWGGRAKDTDSFSGGASSLAGKTFKNQGEASSAINDTLLKILKELEDQKSNDIKVTNQSDSSIALKTNVKSRSNLRP